MSNQGQSTYDLVVAENERLRARLAEVEKERDAEHQKGLKYLQAGGVVIALLKRWVDGGECFCTSEGVAARGPCEYCLTQSLLKRGANGLADAYLREFQSQLGKAREECDALREALDLYHKYSIASEGTRKQADLGRAAFAAKRRAEALNQRKKGGDAPCETQTSSLKKPLSNMIENKLESSDSEKVSSNAAPEEVQPPPVCGQTPRTDAFVIQHAPIITGKQWTAFARDLERDLADTQSRCADLAEWNTRLTREREQIKQVIWPMGLSYEPDIVLALKTRDNLARKAVIDRDVAKAKALTAQQWCDMHTIAAKERNTLQAQLDAAKAERDTLAVQLNRYGIHFRRCLGEGKCTCGLDPEITAPN